jgi:hypothetical protein
VAVDKLGLKVDKNFDGKDFDFEFDWSQKTDLLVKSLKAILP